MLVRVAWLEERSLQPFPANCRRERRRYVTRKVFIWHIVVFEILKVGTVGEAADAPHTYITHTRALRTYPQETPRIKAKPHKSKVRGSQET